MGPISTPMGSVTMGVTYRTRLTLSPQKLDRSAPVLLKTDHFESGLTAEHGIGSGRSCGGVSASFTGGGGRGSSDETRGSDKNLAGWFESRQVLTRKHHAAFVDYGDESSAPSIGDQCVVPDLTASFPFPWVADSSGTSSESSTSRTDSAHNRGSGSGGGGGPASSSSSSGAAVAVAAVPGPALRPHGVSSLARARPSADRISVASSSESPPPEDFVVVSSSPPFASREAEDGDLGTFYHALRTATPLLSSFDDQIVSVEDQLRSLEVDKKEFDSFVNQLSSRDDMNVSEATAAEMSDGDDDDPGPDADDDKEDRRKNGGGGRSASLVPMPLMPSASLWLCYN